MSALARIFGQVQPHKRVYQKLSCISPPHKIIAEANGFRALGLLVGVKPPRSPVLSTRHRGDHRASSSQSGKRSNRQARLKIGPDVINDGACQFIGCLMVAPQGYLEIADSGEPVFRPQ